MKKSISSKALTKEQMKRVIGGVENGGGLTDCEVYCKSTKKWEKGNCGLGVACGTDGTKITCGSNPPVEKCPDDKPTME